LLNFIQPIENIHFPKIGTATFCLSSFFSTQVFLQIFAGMYADFIRAVEYQLRNPLPGKSGQEMMRPYMPLSPKLDPPPLFKPKEGAVLALFYPVDNVPHLLLMERPSYQGAHSGQISFPGGKVETSETHLDAAIREAWEETGVVQDEVRILGELSKVYVWASNFNIQPFVGYTAHRPEFMPDQREVAAILETPVDIFFREGIIKEKPLLGAMGIELMAPYFDVFDKTLWGATAMIISEMMHVIHHAPQDFYKLEKVIRLD
jgi:8-oxo-dGTP pyrophosphatase MutT (NUDIX family)